MKRRICIVLTARGNYAKMKTVMRAVRNHPQLELQVVVGGSIILDKYGKILENKLVDEFPIDHLIHFLIEGETPLTMAKSAGLAVTEFANAFGHLRPDVVVIIGDRYECLAITMAATYMNIAVAHVEGGELSGSIDESIRHAITKMAHVHFPASKDAAERIKKMGEKPGSIFMVGATSFDVLASMDLDNMEAIRHHQTKAGVGAELAIEPGRYIVVSQHPVTTEYADNLGHINETILAIDKLGLPTFWIWPNMDAGSDGISKGLRLYRERRSPTHMRLFKSLPIELYAPLIKNAACLVGNSSSGIREAAFLGTPVVNIGSRQQGRERGPNATDVPYDHATIIGAIESQIAHGPYPPCYIYGDGKSGEKIADILASFAFEQQKLNAY
ncbi:UDP-N-acetylglucosamine 2-epimerase (hydrolyzing) [Nitratidesulfovibrio sp. HK-II]|uniref:UDP-N-acetylglucosamine 2-epimerase n=1 Tax=Nitratidesulfovibrio sp. HK-II TaxID=2009266 RepID=UPI000E2F9875|nr:UDP-N-acetylglucosamine 2-epimerase [Nitratidesulfovibrio sp. HK-II]GBO98040.1 UDP-N-acetylglucosamine 2-epimerase [Nitratidesulfovibrio sp. HK-II]